MSSSAWRFHGEARPRAGPAVAGVLAAGEAAAAVTAGASAPLPGTVKVAAQVESSCLRRRLHSINITATAKRGERAMCAWW